MNAFQKLAAAAERAGSLLSIGLEPCPEYLPTSFAPTIDGYYEFLALLIEATRDRTAAYKFNLAFFEALGPEGTNLLYRVRELLPDDVLIIADAKRGDIGSSARRYAEALYDRLGADSATVNPLMGRDTAEEFLNYNDKLTFFLVLTSNPGAADFLLKGGLYRRIAEHLIAWDPTGTSAGFVVGATREGDAIAELRGVAPGTPFLVPGVGAQGGDLARVLAEGAATKGGFAGTLIHVTRGILPQLSEDSTRDEALQAIREKADFWNQQVKEARGN